MTEKDIKLKESPFKTFASIPSHTRTSIIDIAQLIARKDARLHFERLTSGIPK